MIRTSVFAIAASAVLATAASAGETVSYDRETLSDPAAVAALYADIEKAAYKACKDEMWSSPVVRRKLRTCVARTVAETVAAVDAPELTAYATAQAGGGERLASN